MKQITELLRAQLKQHPGVTLCGGEAQTITRRDGEVARRIPAYFDEQKGEYEILVPASEHSGIVFMRTLSNAPIANTRNAHNATVRVVVWANADKLTSATDGLIMSLYRMSKGSYSGNGIARMVAAPVRMLTDSEARGEWLNFDLDEQETQYMMRPFFVGGFDVETSYVANLCAVAPQSTNAC